MDGMTFKNGIYTCRDMEGYAFCHDGTKLIMASECRKVMSSPYEIFCFTDKVDWLNAITNLGYVLPEQPPEDI